MVGLVFLAGCPFGADREPPEGGEVRIAIRRPGSLDPSALRDAASLLIARQIYEPLAAFDPQTSELQPALAARWEVLDEGSRFVFHLRPGSRFHSGRAVTAEDVRFALNRLARRDTGSETSFLLDMVAGFERVNITGEAAELEGVRALDERTLEFRLKAPWMNFPYVLTHPSTAPIPREALEADPAAFAARPVGNGPFELVEVMRPGEDVVLRRFAGFAGGRSVLESAVFRVYEQAEGAWRDFEAGNLDVVEVPPGRIGLARAKYSERGFTPLAAGLYVAFNLRNPKFGDVRLRQSISLAVNREAIARTVYSETVVPGRGMVPPQIPGGDPAACDDLCMRDPARAVSLLREALGGGAPELAYDYPTSVADEAMARSIQSSLSDIGVNVVLRPRARELHAFFDLLGTGQQEMFRLVWPAEYPLADWFLSPLFRAGSPDNHTGYAVPDIDALLMQARSTPDRSEAARHYGEVERRVLSDMVVVPIGFFQNRYAAAARLTGFVPDQLGLFDVGALRLAS